MTAPFLNRKLVLEARDTTPDGAGGFSTTWSTVGTHWGEISFRSGQERDIGQRSVASATLRIVVRAAPDGAPSRPKPNQRFREGSRIFEILAVTENNRNPQYLDCWAKEGFGE